MGASRISKMPSRRNMVLYRTDSVWEDVPPSVLFEHFSFPEYRLAWDGSAYDVLKEVRRYSVDTGLVYIKCKT